MVTSVDGLPDVMTYTCAGVRFAIKAGDRDNAAMNIVVLVVDRLHAGYLGCYGNSWIATPQMDRLSVESFVFDQALAAGAELRDTYAGYWFGRHPAATAGADTATSLPESLRAAGLRTTLMTDDRSILQLPGAQHFDESLEVDTIDGQKAADEIEQTHLAHFFAAATQWLETQWLEAAGSPFLLWLHTRGLGGPWDAPREFRGQYAEEDEAEPPWFVDVPCRMLEQDYDADELWGVVQAYAGQVSLLDACIGVITEQLRLGPRRSDTLFSVISPRGFPLGEHRCVGAFNGALYGELLHVPWTIKVPLQAASIAMRSPGSADNCSLGQAARSQVLAQPADLYATLLDCCGAQPAASSIGLSMVPVISGQKEAGDARDRICFFADDRQQAIRTPAWYLRASDSSSEAEESTSQTELFTKPDDRWEVNDVADRCRETVIGLHRALSEYRRTLAEDSTQDLPPLDAQLVSPPE